MTHLKVDLCIIGAGSAGLSVAAGAAQMGASVVLIERAEMGGDCLNAGCIPSKALIAAAKHAYQPQHGAAFGVEDTTPQVDFAAVKDHVRRVIDTIAPVDSQERFEGLGCTVIRADARFVSRTEVQAGDTIITARRFVIATGSGPFVPPIPGLDGVMVHTNETIFDLRDKPDHLIIIGGGPIGMEMAQAHRRLGCAVTVIEGAKAMGKDDPELAAIVLDRLRGEGVAIMEDAKAERVSGGEGGAITVHTSKGRVTGTHLLVAVGRAVKVDGMGLDVAGVDHDRKGITVDANLRSVSNKAVYAAGDVAGGLQFTHVAGYHGGQLVRALMFGLPARARTDHIPWATYTDPELAHVGLTEAEARKRHGDKLTVVRSEYAHNDRANTEGRTTGLIKVMVVGGRPVGASIVGHLAGELIGMWAMAIANKLKMTAISNTVLPYPTYMELNKRAAGAYFSPKLFESATVKRVVGLVQRWLP
ncbi:Pyruvate/2-oxoglutarate dehydrogenase complex, dihydrolipoamide dehydrogenase (E3) component [Loktanella fryxellensis]|uniref:Pyruvate/2-oxoglutarate dehydrogenase complex, dihydrolipoamide dehydrogenase (E3) component n=1 Tax=Loktanella fryxellensis TaxID=245187 RepID=A0A1H8A6E2_9RHOB|nr:FAD-dependent oxidoreductase [Loktanella fryxellensis]SEM66056.1 Pyruvate/2-oxoglutarate dehydrogenase complex, dihydrolipoamide dehydrogenase (E3) component [Loktanella fryxellensis]